MKKLTKLCAILIAFCVTFTSLPLMSGELESHALAKNVKLQLSDIDYNYVVLKWNKVKSPSSGYAVFRNGKAIAHLGTKKTSYYNKGLNPGTTYKYQIKTYKASKKTQWYNKKTGKWQYKRPAKKYRGGTRKVTNYSYKKKSNTLTVTTTRKFQNIISHCPPTINVNAPGMQVLKFSATSGLPVTYKASSDIIKIVRRNDGSIEIHGIRAGSTKLTVSQAGNEYYYSESQSFTVNVKASSARPAAPTGLRYTIDGNGFKLSWNAVSGATSYKVYRTVNGSTTSFTSQTTTIKDSQIVEGRSYVYQVYASNSVGMSAGSNKITAILSSGESGSDDEETYTIKWTDWNNRTLKTEYLYAGDTPTPPGTPTRPDDETYTYTFSGWTPSVAKVTRSVTYQANYTKKAKATAVTEVGTYTVTNYLGNENVYTEMSDGTLRTKNGSVLTKDTIPPKADHTKDGTFESNEGHTMIQYHGATFDKYELEHDKDEIYLSSMEPEDYEYFVSMYNGDESKLSIEFDPNVYIQSINSYKEVGDHKYEPETRYYYFKNGHPIAKPYWNGTQFRTEQSGNITKKFFMINTANGSIGDGIGIWVDTFNVNIKYDGKLIHTLTVDTVKDEANGENWTAVDGMSPYRKLALEIADEAIANSGGSTGNVYNDMTKIHDYIKANYKYGNPVSRYGATMYMKCFDGAIILETYSIVRYGKWGFESSGSNYGLTTGKHSAFNTNEQPDIFKEAEGYR